MNREIYALQLIDEETGEVLKDVTPITESKSVIHDGEKLNEVLDLQRDKIQEQSKLYDGFEEDNKNMMGSRGSNNELLPLDENWEQLQNQQIVIEELGSNNLRLSVGTNELIKFKLHDGHKNEKPLYGNFPIGKIGGGISSIAFNLYDEDMRIGCYTARYNEKGEYIFTKHPDWSGKPLIYLGLSIRVPDSQASDIFIEFDKNVGVSKEGYDVLPPTYFYNYQSNLTNIKGELMNQSKSNLVLVTTMQKLLSEKVEELEREKAIIENSPLNIVKKGRTATYTLNGVMKNLNNLLVFTPNSNDIEDRRFTINHESGDYDKMPTSEDVIYTLLKLDKKVDLQCYYNGAGYQNPLNIKELDDGFLYVFEHKGVTLLRDTYKYNGKEKLIIDGNVGIFINDNPGLMVKNDSRWGITERLNFYKSQLEKLKLTQEVDLNLLLTL